MRLQQRQGSTDVRRTGFGALLALAAASSAQAQSVTLFGLFDAAVEHVNKVGTLGSSLTRMPSLTGSFPSRIGLRGSEDLGGGLRAEFVIEEGFTPDMGTLSQGGRAWGRQAFVGLAGAWGTLSFGRQYTMLYWSVLDADVLGPNIYGSGSLDAYIPNARADNALAWRVVSGTFTAGATYSLGRDAANAGNPAGTNCPGEVANDSRACREWSALLKWDSQGRGAALAVDEIRGGPGAFAGLVNSTLADRRWSLNGYASFGALRLTAGLLRRDNGAGGAAARSDLGYAGAVWSPPGEWSVEAEVFRLRFAATNDRASLFAARATYRWSRRTASYLTAGHIGNGGGLALSVSAGAAGSNPASGASQSGLSLGLRHSF